jgi:hypothetical protein
MVDFVQSTERFLTSSERDDVVNCWDSFDLSGICRCSVSQHVQRVEIGGDLSPGEPVSMELFAQGSIRLIPSSLSEAGFSESFVPSNKVSGGGCVADEARLETVSG